MTCCWYMLIRPEIETSMICHGWIGMADPKLLILGRRRLAVGQRICAKSVIVTYASGYPIAISGSAEYLHPTSVWPVLAGQPALRRAVLLAFSRVAAFLHRYSRIASRWLCFQTSGSSRSSLYSRPVVNRARP